jgi:hypothetical protein
MPPPAPAATARPSRSPAERLARHKYTLTVTLILLAHVTLAAAEAHHSAMFSPLLVLTMDVFGFLYLLLRDRSPMAKAILAVGAFAVVLAALSLTQGGSAVLLGALATHATFLLLLILLMLQRLSKEHVVSLDTVMAGVIVYLVMAGFWAQVYAILMLLDAHALTITSGLGAHPYTTLYYFSVTTLTTAGFGDVIPASDLARVLAAYEALVGQVYLVVFIALLMGRHFANR